MISLYNLFEIINTEPTNPQELLKYMDMIKYPKFFDEDKYKIKTVNQLIKSKIGLCYEQVELERIYFKKFDLEFKTFVFYIEPIESNPIHTTLLYKNKNKIYWFEHSWGQQKGIRGPFLDYNYAIDYITDKLKWNNNKIKIKEYDNPKFGITINEFGNYIIRDY